MSNQIEQIRTRVKTEQKLTEGLFEKGDNSYFDGQNDAYDTILRFIDYLYAGTVPTDVQEAAEITHDEGMELANDYNYYLATGLKEGWKRPIGPKWMMEFAKKRFIAGTQYERERIIKMVETAGARFMQRVDIVPEDEVSLKLSMYCTELVEQIKSQTNS